MGGAVKNAALAEMEELIRAKLEEGGKVTFSPKGKSMLPMLRSEGDSVTLVKPPARLKRGTVALFISKTGEDKAYILHRLVRIENGRYFFCGDNRTETDEPVGYGDIIGVVSDYESRGRKRSVKEPWYRLYSCWMVATSGFRRGSLRFQRTVLRIRKKLKG
ncbi:MAG: S24/S26 family peptidase [Clostridiales bacterium]|nr:S24/S26 family peptidase [Clostridiales bacterium]